MKKMKKALFAVFAAFSLSACDFDIQKLPGQVADTVGGWIESVKDFVTGGGKDDDKDKKEEQPCEHQDANHDGVCDLCGETGLVVTHTDANHDHLCDECGAEVSQCKDENNDHLCDECGATLSTCKDENNDFKCDICGKDLAAVSFELDTSAAIKEFAKDAEFSSAGVKVVVTSEVGSTQEITELTFSEPDMTTVGEKTISVSYSFAGVEHSDEYKINVSYWSEMDLAVLRAGTYFGKYANAPLPYLPGFNMRVEYELDEEGYLEGFKVVADNFTDDGYLDLYNAFTEIDVSAMVQGTEVSFKFAEVAGQFEGFHGLSQVSVFSLVPSYVVIEEGVAYNERFFVFDECYILGINEQGQLNIEIRRVNSMLDGIFGTDVLDGMGLYYATALNPYLQKILFNYYSEISASKFVLPKVSSNALLSLYNYATSYPLAEALDEYDLSWQLQYARTTTEDLEKYTLDLVNAGYEAVVNQGQQGEYTSYVFESETAGRLEIIPAYEDDLGELTTGEKLSGIVLEFYYVAPETYTTHLDNVARALGQILGVELELDADSYPRYGVLIAEGSLKAEETVTAEELIENLARTMLLYGFNVTSEIAYQANYKQYSVSMSNGVYSFTLYVDETASEAGFGIEFYISDSQGLTLTNAEIALQNAYYALNKQPGLKGVDYFENADSSFSFSFVAAEGASEEELQAGAEKIGEVLGESFVLASSEAGDEGTWVATFNAVDYNVQVVSVSSLDENNNVVCSVTFSNHRFTTPLSVITDFVVSETGADPKEGAIVENEGKYTYYSSMSGEYESLEGVAAAFAENLPEGFVLVESEAALSEDPSWIQVYANEEAKIQATVVVISDGDNKYTVYIRTEYIMPKIPTAAVIAFFEEAGIANVPVPNYTTANVDASIETDDSYEGYYDIYIEGSSHDEMVEYKNDLLLAGWTLVGESEDGDYRLTFGSSGAYVDLLDYGEYINLSFYFKQEEENKAAAFVADFTQYLGSDQGEIASGVYGIYGAFGVDDEGLQGIMDYVDMIFENIFPTYSAESENWAVDDSGVYSITYSSSEVSVEFYVYLDTLYVDGEGYIVDEGTEGATPVEAMVLEGYAKNL